MESADLLRHIRKELQRKIEIPTPEWKTSRQWAIEWGLKQSQANRILNLAVEDGIMEVKTFRIPCPTKDSYPTPHYRQKPNPKPETA